MLKTYAATPICNHGPITFGRKLDKVPLPSEPHTTTWQCYQVEAAKSSAWEVLRKRVVQLQFPIQEGISQTPVYHAATKQGLDVSGQEGATGLVLEEPEGLQLHIYQSVAGAVPVLIAATRVDFCALVQALVKRNEPAPIPDSMGACMVAGYNNWDRIHAYRRQWFAAAPERTNAQWPEAFQQIIPQKHLYQDRFIILSQGSYSNVGAAELDLGTEEWLSLSLQIRLEHECAHYFTKRLFGVFRQHLHDELLADYAGIVAALGYYRADWFLRFMGLEHYPDYRPGGRLENYLDPSWQQEPALSQVKEILVAAAHNVQRFDCYLASQTRDKQTQAAILCAIAGTSLIELAAKEGDGRLADNFTAWHTAVATANSNGPLSQAIATPTAQLIVGR
jgi:hypothetical protein